MTQSGNDGGGKSGKTLAGQLISRLFNWNSGHYGEFEELAYKTLQRGDVRPLYEAVQRLTEAVNKLVEDNEQLRDENAKMRYEKNRVEEALAEMEKANLTDYQTGLSNRRHFEIKLDEAQNQLERQEYYNAEPGSREASHENSYVIMMIDLNGLKPINDNEEGGHAAGDMAIEKIAKTIREQVRPGDVAARLGGDEFAVLLTLSENETCDQVVNSFKRRFGEEGDIAIKYNKKIWPLTASIGGRVLNSHEPISDQINQVDSEMYAHKKQHHDSRDNRDNTFNPAP